MNVKDFQKDLYFFEWELRQQTTSSLQIPSTVLALVGGGIAYLLGTYRGGDFWYVFVTLIGITCVTFALGIYYVGRVLIGYEYDKLPRLRLLNEYHTVLREHCGEPLGESPKADRLFDQYLDNQVAVAIDRNAGNNRRKYAFLHRSYVATLAAIVLLSATAVPYFIDRTE